MFNLTNAAAKLSNFNPKPEKHGDDHKMAGYLNFEVNRSGAELEHFDSALRASLFREVRSGEQQQLIDGNNFTAIRFPRVGPLDWDEEFNGYELHVGGALGLAEPLVFVDVTVRKFSFQPIEGGSVGIKFQCITHPDQAEAGALCAMQQEEVTLTLIPPVKQDQELDLSDAANSDNDQLQQAADALENAA